MDFFDTVKNRHSYRGNFTDQKVSREQLEKIVLAGTLAPSGCNAQTTRFVVVDEPEIVAKIQAIPGGGASFCTASAYIVCFVDVEPGKVYGGMEFQAEDCAAAVENMLLAITAQGLASVWIDGWLRRESRNRQICDILGAPESKIARVILPIGYAAEAFDLREKMAFEERVGFNKF
ncbi:MAG: nitroreductase family protein [Phycisphaerae bacterium]|jgi:nitroreductase